MTRNRQHFLVALLTCLFIFEGTAQEQLGMRTDRHAGIWSATINPANAIFLPYDWDVNVVSASLFADNSYIFARNTSLPHLLTHTEHLVTVLDEDPENPFQPHQIVQDFYTARKRMYGAMHLRMQGPSAMLKIGKQNAVGFSTGLRLSATGYSVQEPLAYESLLSTKLNRDIKLKPFSAAGMVWGEFGLHYAHQNPEHSDYRMAFGFTGKYLMGYDGAFGRADNAFIYRQLSGDSIQFPYGLWSYGMTTENLDHLLKGQMIRFHPKGHGVALDFGFSIAEMATGYSDEGDYYWRAGASVVDLGFINFSNDAEKHLIEFRQTVSMPADAFDSIKSHEFLTKELSRRFLKGDSLASKIKDNFTLGTPAAISLQFDYRIMNCVYVAALAQQRLPFWRNSAKRPNMYALIPRFEHRLGSVSVPIVYSDYRSLRFGLSGRIRSLVFGTDDLLSMTQKSRLSGGDFYIGLKINAFRFKKPNLALGWKDRLWKKVGCFAF